MEALFEGNVRLGHEFAMRVNDGDSLYLKFSKHGYFPAGQSFSAPETVNYSESDVLAGRRIPRSLVERRNLRIVMEKQGRLTRLASGTGKLVYKRGGTGDVLRWTPTADG